jgi:hypothetical protein
MPKVVEETPELGQGETTENPSPTPNANSTSVRAAEATPPARMAGHATADI